MKLLNMMAVEAQEQTYIIENLHRGAESQALVND